MRPRVSIIIPAYNPGSFLMEAIESVRGQTFIDWEAIIIDDGSEPPIQLPVPVDPRIRLLRQPNRGLSAARNAGLDASCGRLIAFLDADDIWLSTKLDTQVEVLEANPDAILCHTQMQFIDEKGEEGGLGWGGEYETYEDLLDGCGVCVSSVVIKRDVLFRCGFFDPLLNTAQDYDLWLKATRYGRMAALDEPLTLYRWHANNMSRNYMQTHRELTAILQRHLEIARRAGDRKRIYQCQTGLRRTKRNTAMQAANAAVSSLKAGNKRHTLRHSGNALRIDFATSALVFWRMCTGRLLKRIACPSASPSWKCHT